MLHLRVTFNVSLGFFFLFFLFFAKLRIAVKKVERRKASRENNSVSCTLSKQWNLNSQGMLLLFLVSKTVPSLQRPIVEQISRENLCDGASFILCRGKICLMQNGAQSVSDTRFFQMRNARATRQTETAVLKCCGFAPCDSSTGTLHSTEKIHINKE